MSPPGTDPLSALGTDRTESSAAVLPVEEAVVARATSEAATLPTLRWMLGSPWRILALAGGAGLPRFAPGTWGSLAGWIAFNLLAPAMTDLTWAGLIAAGLYFGGWAAQHTGDALGAPDSRHIVVDEVFAIWIVLWLLPASSSLGMQAVAFVLFRIFDIAKPAPIGFLDARFKNGFGVMLDDLVAAFYTLLVIAVGVRFFG